MGQAETEAIWHCPCEPDRKLAETLVGCLAPNVWTQLAQHYGKPYPYTIADKFDLVYTFMGCKSQMNERREA